MVLFFFLGLVTIEGFLLLLRSALWFVSILLFFSILFRVFLLFCWGGGFSVRSLWVVLV